MARLRPKKTKEENPTDVRDVEFSEVRKMVRTEIEKRYGGVAKFLHSDKGKEFGGLKIKPYLYDTGPTNFKVISSLCSFLGLGTFNQKVVVTRTYSYQLWN